MQPTLRRWMIATAMLLTMGVRPAVAQLVNPIPQPIRKGAIRVKLETVATGLTSPVWAVSAPADANRLFVADQTGTLWAIALSTGDKSVFLDVSARLVPLGAFGPGTYDERGFLGFAFHPDYATNGLLYTYTSEPVAGPADYSTIPMGSSADCQSVVLEWHVPDRPGGRLRPRRGHALLETPAVVPARLDDVDLLDAVLADVASVSRSTSTATAAPTSPPAPASSCRRGRCRAATPRSGRGRTER